MISTENQWLVVWYDKVLVILCVPAFDVIGLVLCDWFSIM